MKLLNCFSSFEKYLKVTSDLPLTKTKDLSSVIIPEL